MFTSPMPLPSVRWYRNSSNTFTSARVNPCSYTVADVTKGEYRYALVGADASGFVPVYRVNCLPGNRLKVIGEYKYDLASVIQLSVSIYAFNNTGVKQAALYGYNIFSQNGVWTSSNDAGIYTVTAAYPNVYVALTIGDFFNPSASHVRNFNVLNLKNNVRNGYKSIGTVKASATDDFKYNAYPSDLG